MNGFLERRPDLDRGKSLAILLVVLGHLVAREDPAGLTWYEPIRALIYAFHIPFLFFLSGYAARLSGAIQTTAVDYPRLLRRRAERLLPPAVILGLLILIGKFAAQHVIHVDHAPNSLLGGLADMVWHTDRSPAQSVWYLVVLFVYAAAAPPLLAMARGKGLPLLALALALFCCPVPPILFADRAATNFVFFLAGVMAARRDPRWCAWIDARRAVLGALFATALLLAFLLGPELSLKGRMLLVSGAALPALHTAMRHPPPTLARLLDRVTPYAFAIYLLNTIFIGLAKGLMMTILPWNAACFPAYAIILTVAGIGGPVAVRSLARRPARHYARKYAA